MVGIRFASVSALIVLCIGGSATATPPDPVPRSQPGAVGGSDSAAKMLPPNVARAQLVIDPQDDEHRPAMPPELPRQKRWFLVKMCVTTTGEVQAATILRGEEPEANQAVVEGVKTWRYRPFTIDGRPVPFCYVMRLDHNQPGGWEDDVARTWSAFVRDARDQGIRIVKAKQARALLQIDPDRDPHRPQVPPGLPARLRVAVVKLCVSPAGEVSEARLLKGEEPAFDAAVAAKVKTWRYKPLVADGKAARFCTLTRLDFGR
jgi:outer membrane biosynthesis protein TonB